MSLLISCQSVSKSYGSRKLFEGLCFSVFSFDHIGLIGPNGAGKSTFLKILAKEETPDEGTCQMRKDLKIGYVPQMHTFDDLYPEEILFAEINKHQDVADYEAEIEVNRWLSKLGFKSEHRIKAPYLSGGWKKRLAICIALIGRPDVLLLDEPTNHLDLEGILWLEKFLKREAPTFVLISHDRYFLENLTTKIVEINPVYPKGIFAIEGGYSQFLEKKALFLEGQLEQERSIAGKARKETDWMRRSPKARTTKSQARIDAAEQIFEVHQDLKKRNQERKTEINFQATLRQTRQLVSLKSVKVDRGERTLFEKLDLTIAPGTRLGVMGPNGSGKTTLLKLIADEIQATSGTVKRAEDLKIVYFDQHRSQIPLETSLKEALSPTGDYVDYQGRKIHVNGFCKMFLFSPDILELPISKLSGGERARIAIARLMLSPADVLLLDEPTNDLDIQTLETLEENLREFPGAVVLITHDRFMLESLCNQLICLGHEGSVQFFADYHQYEQCMSSSKVEQKVEKIEKKGETKSKTLSYKEKKELEELEKKIQTLESKIDSCKVELNSDLILKEGDKLRDLCEKIAALEKELDESYLRWSELSLSGS